MDLKIGDESFACRPELPPYVVLRFTKAQQKAAKAAALADRTGKGPSPELFMEALGATFDLALSIVQPDEKDRLEEFFINSDLDLGVLAKSVEQLFADYRAEVEARGGEEIPPTVRSSSSVAGPPRRSGPGRVVSLTPGTAKEAPTSSADGASAAS